MKPILLADFGSTYTKVTCVDAESEEILSTARSFTTVSTDIKEGLEAALEQIRKDTGINEFGTMLAASSAAGGLKMVTVGLVPELTAQAAKTAALSAGAKVAAVYSYELSELEAKEIEDLKPDILLLTGGTDGGNKDIVLKNAAVIAGISGDFPVVVACNKSAAQSAANIISTSGKDVRVTPNVMPTFNTINIEPCRNTIREIFLERIIRGKGLSEVKELVEGILMPTPSAVLKALKLLSEGCKEEKGIGPLMAVDVGGATTDVYSICEGSPKKINVIQKGIAEPYEKRTVEGDLGVRYSAPYLVEEAGLDKIAELAGIDKEKAAEFYDRILKSPEVLGKNDESFEAFDRALGQMALRIATRRHAGTLESVYTPMGMAFVQNGKDLTDITTIVGTGGPLISAPEPGELLKGILAGRFASLHCSPCNQADNENSGVLLPKKANLLIDKKYILAAMGLLSEKYPKTAIRIMKRELELIICN